MHQAPAQPSPHAPRDRGLGLVVFGIVEILIGLACAALIPLTVVALAVSPVVELRVALPSLALYGVMAAVFIVLGAGSIRARRWACALTLSLSWVWLITGICTLVLSWLLLPTLWRDLAATSGLGAGAAGAVDLGINVFLSFIYVLLPAAFVLFYRSPDVAATCRARDPDPGWAGRCPQRLLALAVVFALGSLSVFAVPAYSFVFPFFGRLLSGGAGAVCWVLVLVLSAALAWGTCRREPWAWWTAVAAGIAAAVSSAMTFAGIDREVVFEVMRLPPDQLGLLELLWPTKAWIQVVAWLVMWASLLGYLVVVRPLFNPPLGRGEAADHGPPGG
jgi:hypothetical protein